MEMLAILKEYIKALEIYSTQYSSKDGRMTHYYIGGPQRTYSRDFFIISGEFYYKPFLVSLKKAEQQPLNWGIAVERVRDEERN